MKSEKENNLSFLNLELYAIKVNIQPHFIENLLLPSVDNFGMVYISAIDVFEFTQIGHNYIQNKNF